MFPCPKKIRAFVLATWQNGPILFVNGIGIILGALLNVFLARQLGASEFGIYAYALSWLNILCYLSIFGHDTLLLRELSVYRSKNEWADYSALWRHANLLSLTFAAAFSIIIWAFIIRSGIISSGSIMSFCVIGVALPFFVFVRLNAAAVAAEGRPVTAIFPERIGRDFLLIGFLLICLFLGEILRADLALSALTISMAICAFILWFIGIRRGELLQYKASFPIFRRLWFRPAIVFGANGAGQLVLQRTDIIMIGALLGSDDIGVYFIALILAELVAFPHGAMTGILGPKLAEQNSKRNAFDFYNTFKDGRLFILVVGGMVGMLILILGPHLLSIIGRDFENGFLPLSILIAGQIVRAICGPVQLALNMMGGEKQILRCVAIMAIFNIVMNGILIPKFGISGAAAATSIVNVCGAIWMLIYLKAKLKIDL